MASATSSSPPVRLHIEYAHTLDARAWERDHAEGLVPNRLPYGLHWLADHGFELDVLPATTSRVVGRLLGGAGRRVSDGFDLVDALRDRRRRLCDLALCWDERTGVPASLRSRIPGEPPVAMGTLWGTDPHASRRARVLTREATRRSAAVWANTEEQLAVLSGWGVPRSRLHLLRTPGIDVEFWRAENLGPEPDLVVGVGSDRHRDHELLIEAVRRLRPRRRVRLELVTEFPLHVPPELGVRHDSLTHRELRTLYTRAAVVAVALKPNLHVSGATVILEAMACERPVVVTGTAGVAAYVASGETGTVVPVGDADALAAALAELLSDPARARELGGAGRRRVEALLSSHRTAARLAEILRSI